VTGGRVARRQVWGQVWGLEQARLLPVCTDEGYFLCEAPTFRAVEVAAVGGALGSAGADAGPDNEFVCLAVAVAAREDELVGVLVGMGLVTPDRVEQVQGEAHISGQELVEALVQRGFIRPADVLKAKAAQYGTSLVQLEGLSLPEEVIRAVPAHIARRFRVVPMRLHEGALTVAVADPSDIGAIDALQYLLRREVEVCVAAPEEIEAALKRYYGRREDAVGRTLEPVTEEPAPPAAALAAADAVETDTDAPIIRLVNSLMVEAFRVRASDIHLEPLTRCLRVRFRIDGILHKVRELPLRLHGPIISRLKIQSGMTIDEKRVPQDGRIQMTMEGKVIDLRVSCIPTTHGESIVMRILDKSSLQLGLPELGFFTDDQQTFERLINLPDGLLLVTGPTGSGKTTTLYSCLNFLNRPDRKIITVEDPVEYRLGGINQVQVNEAAGLTFATALRAMLRQAPNIIMVGEIRDLETASIAINASLTGHLVFSTLHTNDAPSAITRLIDIGVKPFLVASSVRALLAQRLVRRVCRECAQPTEGGRSELVALGARPTSVSEAKLVAGRGCAACRGSGFLGRIGIFEMFVIDDEIRKLIYERVPASMLRRRARELGMRTLREDGVRKVFAGLTTVEEVVSATVGDETPDGSGRG